MFGKQKTSLWFLVIFLLATLLRVGLALVNREANDDHLEVARMIMQEKRLPLMDDCWECFQPKFYHLSLAVIFQSLNITQPETQTLVAQLLNVLMGALTIWVAYLFIRSLSTGNDLIKLTAFALLAFNPDLIGINAQATNDSLAILLGTLGAYHAFLFLKQGRDKNLLLSMILISLGITAKTNLFAMAMAITAALAVKALADKQKMMFYRAAFFFPLVFISVFVNPISQYLTNYKNNEPVAGMNIGMQPLPGFFEKTYYARPGITSIQDGFFTFKYINLLKVPRLPLVPYDPNYPDHRTSLWTQVYARAHSVHFANWPSSWSTTDENLFPLTRAIFIFALLPSVLLVVGAWISLFESGRAILKRAGSSLQAQHYGLFDFLFWSYVAFVSVYALSYRDFAVMKALFMYPALLSFCYLFIKGAETIQNALKGQKWFMATLVSVTVILIVLYSLDVAILIAHLNSLL